MHTKNRRVILAVTAVSLLAAGVAAGASVRALLSLDDARTALKTDLHEALDTVVGDYKTRSGLQQRLDQAHADVVAHRGDAAALRRENRAMRFDIARLVERLSSLRAAYDVPESDGPAMDAFLVSAREALAMFLRTAYVDRLRMTAPAETELVRAALTDVYAGARSDRLRSLSAVEQALRTYVSSADESKLLLQQIATLQRERLAVVARAAAADRALDEAQQTIVAATEQLAHIQEEVEDVHRQVLAMQSHLAEINAIMRRRTERVLIEKGLLEPGERPEISAAAAPLFRWPVDGTFTAGFRDRSYVSYFGVPHHGQDIAVPQGSAVHASADGVVFLVRDGGRTGYTYVLVGHANGYATLYGHLSYVTVEAGQEVEAGDVIAFSGGQPGTPGAGPMTTGPHVHFEVIKDGENIDPRSVIDFGETGIQQNL